MSYRLYTRTDCAACLEARTYLEDADIIFELVDLDTENSTYRAGGVMIVPALFREHKLMAYGSDIMNYINVLDQRVCSA